MSQAVRFQEILRRLAIIDEGFVEGHAGLGLGLPASRLLDPKTAALVRVGALVAIGSPGVCLEWGTTRALARAPPQTRLPTCCWRSLRSPDSAGSTRPSLTWQPPSGLTSRPR